MATNQAESEENVTWGNANRAVYYISVGETVHNLFVIENNELSKVVIQLL